MVYNCIFVCQCIAIKLIIVFDSFIVCEQVCLYCIYCCKNIYAVPLARWLF